MASFGLQIGNVKLISLKKKKQNNQGLPIGAALNTLPTFHASNCFSSKFAELSGSEGVSIFFNSLEENLMGNQWGNQQNWGIERCWNLIPGTMWLNYVEHVKNHLERVFAFGCTGTTRTSPKMETTMARKWYFASMAHPKRTPHITWWGHFYPVLALHMVVVITHTKFRRSCWAKCFPPRWNDAPKLTFNSNRWVSSWWRHVQCFIAAYSFNMVVIFIITILVNWRFRWYSPSWYSWHK